MADVASQFDSGEQVVLQWSANLTLRKTLGDPLFNVLGPERLKGLLILGGKDPKEASANLTRWLQRALLRPEFKIAREQAGHETWHGFVFGCTPYERDYRHFEKRRREMHWLSEDERGLVAEASRHGLELSTAEVWFLGRDHAEDRPKNLSVWFRKFGLPRLRALPQGVLSGDRDARRAELEREAERWVVTTYPVRKDARIIIPGVGDRSHHFLKDRVTRTLAEVGDYPEDTL